jgi:predicted nucleotidyltransferase
MKNERQFPIDHERLSAVAAQFGLRLVLLFGSVARGQAQADSDCDIAVAGCPPDRVWDLSVALQETIRSGAQLDLVRLEPADPLFRYEILSDAVLPGGNGSRSLTFSTNQART